MARRVFAPTIEQVELETDRARAKLLKLEQELLGYVSDNGNFASEIESLKRDLTLDNLEATVQLEQLILERLNADWGKDRYETSKQRALQAVEFIWIRYGLAMIDKSQLSKELDSFLDACDSGLQELLHGRSGDKGLTLLQQVKNQVINPVTGQLNVH